MLTEQEIEKFAEWIIKQEKILMDKKHPLPKEDKELTNEELLKELGLKALVML